MSDIYESQGAAGRACMLHSHDVKKEVRADGAETRSRSYSILRTILDEAMSLDVVLNL